jgi:hypothetical protein
MTETTDKPTGTCRVCLRDDITLTKNGRVRSHGPRQNPCGGGSTLPLEADTPPLPVRLPEESDADFHAQMAQWAVQHPANDPRPTREDLRDAREVLAAPDVPEEVWSQAAAVDNAADEYGVRPDVGLNGLDDHDGPRRQPSWAGVNPFSDQQPDDGRTPEQQAEIDRRRADPRSELDALPSRKGPAPDPFAVVSTDDILSRAAELSPQVAALKQKYRPDPEGDRVSGTDRTFRNNLDRSGATAPRSPAADQDADAAAFLGTRSAPVVSGDQDADAAAFLAGSGPGDDSGPGPYFRATYDGTCGPCGEWFPEGSLIRATGDGEYQSEDCCGIQEDMAEEDLAKLRRTQPKQVRPRRVADAAPMNGNNQYRLPHPRTGKLTAFSRCTTFVKAASDHRALFDWELRCALVGMVRDGSVGEAVSALMRQARVAGFDVATVVKTEKQALNVLAGRAKDAAKTKEQGKSSIGTQVHKFTENVDAGMITVDAVPKEHRAAVRRYRDLVEASGFEVVPSLIEFTTALPGMRVAGRGDQVWRRTEDGVHLIVDKKTGELTWGKDEIAAQLAVYAHGFNENGVCVWTGEGDKIDAANWQWVRPVDGDGRPIVVSETEAVVVHMPQDGRGDTLHTVPIDKGWRIAQVCADVRALNRNKVDFALIDVPDPVDGPDADPRDTGYAPSADGGDPRDAPLTRQAKDELDAHLPPAVLNRGQVRAELGFASEVPAEVGRVASAAELRAVPPETPASVAALAEKVMAMAAPSQPRLPSWEVSFSLVRTKEDANRLWREAKADPEVGPERLAALVASGRSALDDWEHWSRWEQKFRMLRDRDDANAAYRDAKADPGMTPERLADLLRIGRETLAVH